MAVINQVLVEVTHLVARAAVNQIRQATELPSSTLPLTSDASLASSAIPTSSVISPSVGPPTSFVPSASPSQTTLEANPNATGGTGNTGSNNAGNNNNNNNNTTSSPLLFFVALGFGVVFTNLWIIVGVKYCFRYNARNRQMRLNEDGEPINLENMPRPHRRRREKKLMTMEEVNEKFPVLKYKNWVSDRAKEGLPTNGGVTAPTSRANSVRSVEGIVPELPSKERDSEDRPMTSASRRNLPTEQDATPKPADTTTTTTEQSPGSSAVSSTPATTTTTTTATTAPDPSKPMPPPLLQRASEDDADEDEEHINAAIPPECLGTSGDTCAICIDTLEDDDDVRGLTCGHAFHAVCLDPWLTSRRACCPLCKADYYTPKPRPAPAEGEATTPAANFDAQGRSSTRMNLPAAPPVAWYNLRRPGMTMSIAQRFGSSDQQARAEQQQRNRDARRREARRARRTAAPEATATSPVVAVASETTQAAPAPRRGIADTFRSAFPAFRFSPQARTGNSGSDAAGPVASGANVTPSQLEAGTAPAR